MVKLSGTDKDGNILLGFGLSDINLNLLKQGKPILIKKEDTEKLIGHKINIMIFHGKTEKDMQKKLSDFIGPDTKIIMG